MVLFEAIIAVFTLALNFLKLKIQVIVVGLNLVLSNLIYPNCPQLFMDLSINISQKQWEFSKSGRPFLSRLEVIVGSTMSSNC